jgi:hypothetical protein
LRTINTSDGPKQYDPTRPGHTLNTSAVVEEDLQYLDEEPEIIAVLPGGDWCAVIAGEAVPVVAFVALDDASVYGVAVGVDGLINLTTGNVEELDGFTGYKQANINDRSSNAHSR